MYRLVRWLWRKAEVTTVEKILDMGKAYYATPPEFLDTTNPINRAKLQSFEDGQRFLSMIRRRFQDQNHTPVTGNEPSTKAINEFLHRTDDV